MRVIALPGVKFGVGLFSYAGKLNATMGYLAEIAQEGIIVEFSEILDKYFREFYSNVGHTKFNIFSRVIRKSVDVTW